MHQSLCRAAELVASALLFIPIAIARETPATLSGTITDTSGSVVAGAALVLANVETGVERLQRLEPILAPRVKDGKLKVVGGVYDLLTGSVTLIGKKK